MITYLLSGIGSARRLSAWRAPAPASRSRPGTPMMRSTLPGARYWSIGTRPAKAPRNWSISAGRPASEVSNSRSTGRGANLASRTVSRTSAGSTDPGGADVRRARPGRPSQGRRWWGIRPPRGRVSGTARRRSPAPRTSRCSTRRTAARVPRSRASRPRRPARRLTSTRRPAAGLSAVTHLRALISAPAGCLICARRSGRNWGGWYVAVS